MSFTIASTPHPRLTLCCCKRGGPCVCASYTPGCMLPFPPPPTHPPHTHTPGPPPPFTRASRGGAFHHRRPSTPRDTYTSLALAQNPREACDGTPPPGGRVREGGWMHGGRSCGSLWQLVVGCRERGGFKCGRAQRPSRSRRGGMHAGRMPRQVARCCRPLLSQATTARAERGTAWEAGRRRR